MLHRLCTLLPALSFLVAASVSAQTEKPRNLPNITRAEAERDLGLLFEGLDKFHTGMYWYTPRDSVAAAFAKTRDALPDSLDGVEMYRRVAPLVSLAREDHTRIGFPEALNRYRQEEAGYFPASVAYVGRRLYVTHAYVADSPLRPGDELVSIDGHAAGDLLDTLGQFLASDGYIKLVKAADLSGRTFGMLYVAQYGEPVGGFAVRRKRDGEQGTQRLPAMTVAEIEAFRKERDADEPDQAPKQYMEYEVIDDSTAYLGVHSFYKPLLKRDPDDDNYARFLEESFADIERRGIRHLIVDVSRNGGGNEGNENLLYSYLGDNYQKYNSVTAKTAKVELDNGVDKPQTLKSIGWLERVFVNRTRPDGVVERKEGIGYGLMAYKKEPEHKYRGAHTYVLIGPVTYSGGSEFANMMRYRTDATFVGQETGGGRCGNTSGYSATLELPNSGLRVQLPALKFDMAYEGVPCGRGVLPDVEVVPTIEDVLAGREVYKARALELVRGE